MKKRLKISTKKNILNFLKKNSKKKILIITAKNLFLDQKLIKYFKSIKLSLNQNLTLKLRN